MDWLIMSIGKNILLIAIVGLIYIIATKQCDISGWGKLLTI